MAGIQYYEPTFTSRGISNDTVQQEHESLKFLLLRVVTGEDRKKLQVTGFACHTTKDSAHCVTNCFAQVSTMTVHIASHQPVQETVVRPYARQEDHNLLKNVTPVKILQIYITMPPACQYIHGVPAVIFSSSGFVGNFFHEFNEIIIPLFITTSHLRSRVQFILEDYKASFVRKYSKPMSQLSAYEVINPVADTSVHCFPGAIIGLKFQGHLALNSSDTPGGYSFQDFKQFLRQTYNLKFAHVSEIRRPNLVLVSRRKTRRFLNEDEMVSTMEELGFRVIIVARNNVLSNLNKLARIINSCRVFVGAHGAGLTNELFLPAGAVMVQVDLIGLEWPAKAYYGDPARAMDVHYLPYRIEPEESSLLKVFGRNHTVFKDPKSFSSEVGREIYLNNQNVRINLARFRETMVEALSIVEDTDV
ncbi:O-linked-mannose beta-1,4-N-acetylglucosaminyltransferase 2-like [Olea europaea subsp. europaea]|uniref:O-linked-mannose beta-1,4-N-acetylglucosaminyltransferase 2-like n=1 Tax=Olea europaea subsp. europaea TaxID=158383 RepID=A0A8S0TFU4_OLEEU|nr:O-linked-mannose beta-1,4-N-acetylglucosaminyltransferase 2-like [Olea europaea subsp. europaea]